MNQAPGSAVDGSQSQPPVDPGPPPPPTTARRSWPLAATLALCFGSLTLAAVGSVLMVAVTSGSLTARDLLAARAVQLVDTVSRRVRNHLKAASDHAEFMGARLVEENLLALENETKLMDALRHSVAAAPQVASTVFMTENLLAFDVNRTADGVTAAIRDWSEVEGAVDGMTAIRRAQEGFWAEPVFVGGLGQAVVNYRVPVRDGDRFLGGLVTTITTLDLNQFVSQIAAPLDATAFVLIGPDEVLAYTGGEAHRLPRSADRPLPDIATVPDPVIRNLWNEKVGSRHPYSDQLPGFEVRVIDLENTDEGGALYTVVYEHLGGIGPVPWIVGCYFRSEDLEDAFDRINLALLTGLLMLVVALVGVYLVGRSLARPILDLAEATSLVGVSGPSKAPVLPESRLREISLAAHGFNDMVHGLRERERLRETFGKYVPDSVADAIVEQGGTLKPESRITTTLFTDIVGFSTVAEDMSPEDLIAMLNEYFAAMVGPIESQGGVIHQFQGDAILATFNLPVHMEDHATRAVQAALDIQAMTQNGKFLGNSLPTRVGINTGSAVCGTVGGDGRLGFTVHGDEVNLAARIEQLNKTHGTRILVAESTVELCGDQFEFQRVGEVPVRGRHQSVVLYRVLGEHNLNETWQPT